MFNIETPIAMAKSLVTAVQRLGTRTTAVGLSAVWYGYVRAQSTSRCMLYWLHSPGAVTVAQEQRICKGWPLIADVNPSQNGYVCMYNVSACGTNGCLQYCLHPPGAAQVRKTTNMKVRVIDTNGLYCSQWPHPVQARLQERNNRIYIYIYKGWPLRADVNPSQNGYILMYKVSAYATNGCLQYWLHSPGAIRYAKQQVCRLEQKALTNCIVRNGHTRCKHGCRNIYN